jgi:hypothetical protein
MARALQQNPSGQGTVELGDLDTLNVGLIQLGTGVAVESILDEDTLVTASATALPTQQSVKAYVDNRVTKVQVIAVPVNTFMVDTFADTVADAVIWHYVVKNGGNLRAGTITAVWNSTTNDITNLETNTDDLGSTVGVVFSVVIVPAPDRVELQVTTPGIDWTVLVDRLLLNEVH